MNLTLGVDRANVESKPETMRSAFDFLGKQPKHLAKKSVTLSSKASHNTRTRHLATATNMPSKSLSDTAKRARRRARLVLEAIPGLPTHIVVSHILRSENFDDPADLARLPAVSRGMRDAMAGTGLRFKEVIESHTTAVECLSAVQRLQRRGVLSRRGLLCAAAVGGGHLEELKVLRENDTPWDEWTCAVAAACGHLEVLQWAHANGCPWDWQTREYANGHVLVWAIANGVP